MGWLFGYLIAKQHEAARHRLGFSCSTRAEGAGPNQPALTPTGYFK
jgi:hypothetical protein